MRWWRWRIARGPGTRCTCATGRGTIVNFDLREPNDARAFVVRGARRREVNALTWRNEHALFHASDAVVVELDARKMSAAGDAAVIRRFDGAGDVVNGVDVDQDDAMLAACDDAGEGDRVRFVQREIFAKASRTRWVRHGGGVSKETRRERGCATASTDCRAMKWDVKAKSVPVRTWDARNMLSAEDYGRGKFAARGGRRVSVDRRGREREGVQSADAALVGVLSRARRAKKTHRAFAASPSPRVGMDR